MGAERQPERWTRQRSSDRECLVSILYGPRSSTPATAPPRRLFQRTIATARSTQVTVSSRSITTAAGRFELTVSARDTLPRSYFGESSD
jgi:hypothetical protein